MKVKAVLFDFGDTLVSFENFNYDTSLAALHQKLVENGIVTAYEEFREVYFKVRDRLSKEGESSFREVNFCVRVARVLDELGFILIHTDPKLVSSVEAFMHPLKEALKLKPRVSMVLQELKKKYKVGLVSNFAYPSAIKQTLLRFDLSRFFDTVIISGDIGWRKPSPKIFERALNSLKVSASETVFVGDASFHDIVGAKQLGMKTILLRRFGEKGTMETGNPDKIIHRLEELLLIL